MENASDALKMAFAVFVFIIALSIVFSLISKVKQTADAVLYYSDKTAYYDWIDSNSATGRVVGIDTVISTLKNYRKQNAYVIIVDGDVRNEFNYSGTMDEKINEFIETHIGSNEEYIENIREITVGGEYITAEDGTKVTVRQGQTRTYIVYTK